MKREDCTTLWERAIWDAAFSAGLKFSVAKESRARGVNPKTVHTRLRAGMTMGQALSTPVDMRFSHRGKW